MSTAAAAAALLLLGAACSVAPAAPTSIPNPTASQQAPNPTLPPAPTLTPTPTPTSTPKPLPPKPPSQRLRPRTSSKPQPSSVLRPYLLHEPNASGASPKLLPLVVILHGYGASAKKASSLLQLPALARARGLVFAVPDGTRDRRGARGWNATDACCDFDGREVDDVEALSAVIDDVARRTAIDASRLYVVGYSNGAFMAHRLACARADLLAGIAAVAGVGYLDDARRCKPADGHAVALLQVHGDADTVVAYEGGHVLGRKNLPRHPGAASSVRSWARHNHCQASQPAVVERLKLGKHRVRAVQHRGCRAPVQLWTVQGGGHVIGINRADFGLVLDTLLARPKAAPLGARASVTISTVP